MCVSIEPHAEWHYLHKWLPCLLQRSRVLPDWPLLSKPQQTSSSPRLFSTPALKCNPPVVRVHLWTNMHSPALPPDLGCSGLAASSPCSRPSECLENTWDKQLPESFLRTRPCCKCQPLWKWLKSARRRSTFFLWNNQVEAAQRGLID